MTRAGEFHRLFSEPIPRGTHLCQFYKTKEDLLEILIPYFKAGLEANEYCIWITSKPLSPRQAWMSLKKEIPDFAAYRGKGQIKVIPNTEWHPADTVFDADRVLKRGETELKAALNNGWKGLRIGAAAMALGHVSCRDLLAFEQKADRMVAENPIIALCTYPLDGCHAGDIIEMADCHRYTLTKRDGKWDAIEKRPRLSNAYNRGLIEASVDPLVTIDHKGKIADVNVATELITGYSREELIGTDFSNYFTQPEKARKGYRRVFREKVVRDYELIIRHRNGHTTPVVYNASVFCDERGEVCGVFAAARDITQRKRAEQTRAQLAAIVESSDDAIISKDLNGTILSWNQGAERIYGYRAEEIIGRSVSLLSPPHAFDDGLALMKDIGKGKRIEHYETERIRKDGQSIYVSLTLSPLKNEQGKIVGTSAIARDITEQRRAEQALRLASAYNRSLIEASLDPLVTIDYEGRISDVNAATEKVTGCSREELIGTDFSDYFIDSEKARAGYRQVFTDGFVRDYALEIRHRDGAVTPVLYNASVYRNDEGEVLGVFAAARDITDRRLLEEQLRQAQKLEAIGTLAGGIAHDFNNMLAVIIGNAELALDDAPTDSGLRRNLEAIFRAGKRGRDLVRQILTFSCKNEREQKNQSLTPLIEESFRLLRASIPSTIEMILDISTKSDTAYVNGPQFQQILMNLCTNAAHAMRENGGFLRISLKDERRPPHGSRLRTGSYVKLTVSDTGIGMDERVKERIFDPFFTTKEPGEGTGMGLAVVFGIVEAHGGFITVDSKPGKGSTFRILLPKGEGKTAPENKPEDAVVGGEERILFVDDEDAVAEMASTILQRLGYRVTTFTDPSSAMAAFSPT